MEREKDVAENVEETVEETVGTAAEETEAANAVETAEQGEPAGAAETEAAADPRIAELQRQADEHYQRYLRAQADFDNFRKRTLKEKEELSQYASVKLITQLLPVLDNFGRAMQSGAESTDSAAFVKGVDMIYRQLWQVLEGEGLRAMEAVGQPFDPALHEAVMQVESEEYPEGTVVEVIQQGYVLKEKVLRPAMVKVSG